MTLDVLAGGLGGAVGEPPVAQAVNHADQRALGPMVEDEGVAVDLAEAARPRRHPKGQGARPDASRMFSQPFAADDARAATQP